MLMIIRTREFEKDMLPCVSMCIKKEIRIKKSKSYRGCHQRTISESISQRKGKYEWNKKTTCWGYKLEGDPSQMSQQNLNQPIEIEIQNQIRGFHQATISESLSQSKGTYGWNQNTTCWGMLRITRTRELKKDMLPCVSLCLKKEIRIKKSKSYTGFPQATISESISQK